MKYKVEITETLQKVINVEADTEQEAIKQVIQLYRTGEVILYPEDMVDVNFGTIN